MSTIEILAGIFANNNVQAIWFCLVVSEPKHSRKKDRADRHGHNGSLYISGTGCLHTDLSGVSCGV